MNHIKNTLGTFLKVALYLNTYVQEVSAYFLHICSIFIGPSYSLQQQNVKLSEGRNSDEATLCSTQVTDVLNTLKHTLSIGGIYKSCIHFPVFIIKKKKQDSVQRMQVVLVTMNELTTAVSMSRYLWSDVDCRTRKHDWYSWIQALNHDLKVTNVSCF